jgi:NAD-dependent DNA ligase
MREIPNQPSRELGAQLVVCATYTELVGDVARLKRLELLFVDGWGEVLGEWSSEFNTAADLSTSPLPRFGSLAHFVLGLLQNRVLVGHHVEDSLRVLHREFSACSLEMPEVLFIDTMDLSRQLVPGLGSYTLEALCRRFRVVAPTRAASVWHLLCHLQALDPQDRTPELQLVAAPSPPVVVDPTLEGLTVCLSGFLPHVSQEQLLQRLRAHNATVHESPTPHTDLVVLALGYNPALAAYALSLQIPLLGVEWFDLLCQDPVAARAYAHTTLPKSVSATEPSTLNRSASPQPRQA